MVNLDDVPSEGKSFLLICPDSSGFLESKTRKHLATACKLHGVFEGQSIVTSTDILQEVLPAKRAWMAPVVSLIVMVSIRTSEQTTREGVSKVHKGWLLKLDDAVSIFEKVVGLDIGTLFDSLLVLHINIEGAISCRFVFLKLKVGLCVFGKGVGSTHTRINTYVYIYIYI